MFKLLLKLLVLPPELLKAHAQGYADLTSQACAQHLYTLKHRWALYSLGALNLLVGLILGGVALLLWCALPSMDARHAWVLLALPLSLLALSGLCWIWGSRLRTRPIVNEIKAQIELDLQAIEQSYAS